MADSKKTNGRPAVTSVDVVIVGAGFGGLYALYKMREIGLSALVLEAAGGVGGTWYWNRYPGARCDTESLQYSYQFSEALQQEWEWSERFATQPEILRYIEHVADRFDLRRDIRFETRVTRLGFVEGAGRWQVATEHGDTIEATFCIMATGCLSAPNTPSIKGLDRFAGERYHTGFWPQHEVDFSGKRVGIVGTGSSAIQALPVIAATADHVTVFQRTANYAVPAHNGPLDPDYVRDFKANYRQNRERAKTLVAGFLTEYNPARALDVGEAERRAEYEARWARGGLSFLAAFSDFALDAEANATAASFIHDKIREQVADPELAEKLIPNGIVGCKRLCVDTDYYRTYNRANVKLVDVRANPIEEITDTAVVVAGRPHEIDMLVLATGFDAMTGALARIDIRGLGDLSLADKWRDGPRAYLGVCVEGFPNFFTVTGPGSPSVLTNMVPTIEQHVDFIAGCLAHMRRNGHDLVEASRQAEDDWVAFNDSTAQGTLRYGCNSWYLGANIPGKPRVFMPFVGGLPLFIEKCAEVVADGYRGFVMGSANLDKTRRGAAR